ncbi:MAG: SGNH/GDSL hydrolase family protein [Planctomycetaceae bacterium]
MAPVSSVSPVESPNQEPGAFESTAGDSGASGLPAAYSSTAADLTWREYALLLAQVALALLVVSQYAIEKRYHFLPAMIAITVGFALHALLPSRFRLPFFLVLSATCLVLVLDRQALWVLGFGGGLIGISLLPIAFTLRVVLLVAVAAVLFWLRDPKPMAALQALKVSAGDHGYLWIRDSWKAPFWPILGSMFMFRMIVYMYDMRHWKGRPPFLKTLAYFFMLPNMFFPFYPVVDYRTFCDGYYNEKRLRIYQTGVHWIVTGMGHLLLWRLINGYLVPSPAELRTKLDLLQFLVMNYALYLRVSGQFHLICGILHLFGFNLPRTHNAYFLASSFSDIWRRINIYWKDFMTKVCFFPVFFRLRRWNTAAAVVIGVLWVFLCTWLAHSWQLFWRNGEFPMTWNDALLWLGVGVIVAINSLLDYRRAAQGAPEEGDFSLTRASIVALKTIGVFLCVCVFWGQWKYPEIVPYLLFGNAQLSFSTADAVMLAAWFAAAFAAVVAIQYLKDRGRNQGAEGGVAGVITNIEQVDFERSVRLHLATLVVLVLVGVKPLHSYLGTSAASLIASLQSDEIAGAEKLDMVQGYYEQMNHEGAVASSFLSPARSSVPPSGRFTDMTRPRRDYLIRELKIGWEGEFLGRRLTTNSWGERDIERSFVKPPGTFRMAGIGSSIILGYGVTDDETITISLEKLLNADPLRPGERYEVLNFGMGHDSALQRRGRIEKKTLQFRPDLILYFAHQDELDNSASTLVSALTNSRDIEDPELDALLKRLGATRDTPAANLQRVLSGDWPGILRCIYRRIVERCRQNGVRLLWVWLPMPGVLERRGESPVIRRMAEEAGMEIIDLSDWASNYPANVVTYNDTDKHTTALGDRVIAERLYRVFRERPELLNPPTAMPQTATGSAAAK